MRAAGSEGTYIIKIKDPDMKIYTDKIYPLFYKEDKKISKEFLKLVNEKKITPEYAMKNHYRIVWENVFQQIDSITYEHIK